MANETLRSDEYCQVRMPAGMSPLAGKPYEANIDFEVRFMADSKVVI